MIFLYLFYRFLALKALKPISKLPSQLQHEGTSNTSVCRTIPQHSHTLHHTTKTSLALEAVVVGLHPLRYPQLSRVLELVPYHLPPGLAEVARLFCSSDTCLWGLDQIRLWVVQFHHFCLGVPVGNPYSAARFKGRKGVSPVAVVAVPLLSGFLLAVSLSPCHCQEFLGQDTSA